MWNFLKTSLVVGLLAMAMTFIACQSEEPFATDIDRELTLTATSSVIEMMKRTTSNDGSHDNIVDGASCIGIQFPYSVMVRGTQLSIAKIEDLDEIEKILDAAEGAQELNVVDDGLQGVEIMYPITVTLSDQTDMVIDSETALRDYAKQCIEGGDDTDIECVDMAYPIGLFTYNTDLQQTGSVVVNHDQELRRFLAGLAETDLISIDFPINFILHDSTEATINSNAALEDAMQNAIDSCDEDDDNDYNDDDFTKESLERLLVTCPWSVENPEPIDVDGSEQISGEILIFSEDGTVVINNLPTAALQGFWSVTVSDFKVFVTLEFENALDFNGTRYTYEIGEGRIKMDGGEIGEILLEQKCDSKD